VGSFEYHNTLYGDAARGCHHRGDGPDASQRTISFNRQRHRSLVSEALRRVPWGCETSGPYHQEKEVKHGKEEGCEEAGCQEGRQEVLEEEVVTTTFSIVF
jgi:hypothetical protein